ncbi:MAG: endopeptidase La [Prevotella sp.]|nr:endopeptidase La [Prevotella sp.]
MGIDNQAFSMITDFDGDLSTIFDIDAPKEVPILPVKNVVLFPGVVTSVMVSRESSLALVKQADDKNLIIGVFTQHNHEADIPAKQDLLQIGVYAKVVKVLSLPGDKTTVILQAFARCRLQEITRKRPFLKGSVEMAVETCEKDDEEIRAALEDCRNIAEQYILASEMPDEAAFALRNIRNNELMLNYVCTNMPFTLFEKMNLLECDTLKARVLGALTVLNRQLQLAQLHQHIRTKTREDIDQQQKTYFLEQQIKNIREELGEGESSPERKELYYKAEKKQWSAAVQEVFDKEMNKLDQINPQTPEYNIQLNYLETMVSLPWDECTRDNLDISRATRVLDKDHYGMEKVKQRILEHLAVLRLKGDMKSPILCLVGPPGVGKTSLGKSIARAMKRKYVRMSLGGLHDESEIRGHRRTYIGAMPGRILKCIQKAGSANPVFILDEIDKVTTMNTFNGDPSSALLEVLDPEQNGAFHDNYLDIDYDLSKVMFIATANNANNIPDPLLDRMEVIELSGYIPEEKVQIAKKHLIPKEKENTGLTEKHFINVRITTDAIEEIIDSYTRESGVRQLEKKINMVLRKAAFKLSQNAMLSIQKITKDNVKDYLEGRPYPHDIYQGNDYAGVVTGLAWTSVGGEILFIETSVSKTKTPQLTLTGNLGDVMKESAVLALEYIKSHADTLGLDYRIFSNYNIHVHVPEGATPKDGPSAGITIATSIASALTQRKVRRNTAMTGEITLRGKVLPVGGIKEKILAAKRAGITDILMCHDNEKDVNEIDAKYLDGVAFHYVENVQDVLEFALLDEKVKHPITFSFDKSDANK